MFTVHPGMVIFVFDPLGVLPGSGPGTTSWEPSSYSANQLYLLLPSWEVLPHPLFSQSFTKNNPYGKL